MIWVEGGCHDSCDIGAHGDGDGLKVKISKMVIYLNPLEGAHHILNCVHMQSEHTGHLAQNIQSVNFITAPFWIGVQYLIFPLL